MASSYLDLYTGAGHMRQMGSQGSSSPVHTVNSGVQGGVTSTLGTFWQNGDTQKVVHDQANNKYYGTQSQADLTKGLTESLARLQSELDKGGRDVFSRGWMGHSGGMSFSKFDDKMIADQNAQIASQQNYLNQINNGMYEQEKSTFFDSYDDWTGDWDNVFDARRRNTKIEGMNQEATQKNKEMMQQEPQGSGAVARSKSLSPKLEINTGMSSQADKLLSSLSNTGLGI